MSALGHRRTFLRSRHLAIGSERYFPQYGNKDPAWPIVRLGAPMTSDIRTVLVALLALVVVFGTALALNSCGITGLP